MAIVWFALSWGPRSVGLSPAGVLWLRLNVNNHHTSQEHYRESTLREYSPWKTC